MSASQEISHSIEKAVALHRAGRLDEAEVAYRSVLKLDHQNADAQNLLGLIAQSKGAHQKALEYFDGAIASAPLMASLHYNKANLLVELHHFAEAEAAFVRAISLYPGYADARLNLGALLHKQGNLAAAAEAFRALTQICPADVRGHKNLGRTLSSLQLYSEAESAFKAALKIIPSDVDSLVKLAFVFAKTARLQEAIDTIDQAILLDPVNGEHFSNRANWLVGLESFEEAMAANESACRCDPARAEFFFNYGNTCHAAGKTEQAVTFLKKAIELNPRFTMAYINLGEALKDSGMAEEALEVFDKALALDPQNQAARINKASTINNAALAAEVEDGFSDALQKFDQALALQAPQSASQTNAAVIKTNKALALLALGRFTEGWPAYRHRFEKAKATVMRRMFPYPEWRGEALEGRKLLLWTDQGPGDEVLYGGMIPDVIRKAKKCVLECSQRMVPLFQRSFPDLLVVPQRSPYAGEIDAFNPDFHSSLADIGEYFRPDIESFPRHQGYLVPDAELHKKLRARYAAIADGRIVVGIAWKSANAESGTSKTIPLKLWKDILEMPGVSFVSLQYGDTREELDAIKSDFKTEIYHDAQVDPMRDLDSFAAQVAAMDLVISVSNTTVHFAGAMNVPVWTMVPKGKGGLWYFRTGEATLWYPCMRLFRQSKTKNWSDVVAAVALALRSFASKRSSA